MSTGFGDSHINGKPDKPKMETVRPEDIKYPSLAQQAKNLGNFAKDVARDPRWVDDTEYDRRMKICRACNLYDLEQNRCKKCIKLKARYASKRARTYSEWSDK